MIALSLLLLSSLVAGFADFALLVTPAVGAERLLWPPAGMMPAFLLFVGAAVLFSAGAIIEALRALRKDLRRMGGHVVGVLVALALAGCATAQPQLSREQWLDLKTKTYQGATSAQVNGAAEQLFRLADGDDFTLSYPADGSGMKASRRWLIYFVIGAVMGTEEWTIQAEQRPGSTWVGVDVRNAIGGFVGPGPLQPLESQALYDLFWSRMDYLLGQSTVWRTCDMQSARKLPGLLEPLCQNADDAVPKGVAPAAAR